MTVGQRIAQKRKELSLSQEGKDGQAQGSIDTVHQINRKEKQHRHLSKV